MTPLQLAEELATEQGESFSDQDVQLQFLAWVKEATDDLFHAEGWAFRNAQSTVVTAEDSAVYPLSGDVAEIVSVIDNSNGSELVGLHVSDLTRSNITLTQSGTPRAWLFAGQEDGALLIRFWPVPSDDGEYTVNILSASPTLENTDELPLPKPFLKALRHAVRVLYHENSAEFASVEREQARYNRELMKLRETHVFPTATRRQLQWNDLPTRRVIDVPRLPF